MTQFKVASRMLKETDGEKCPKCNMIFSDFMELDEFVWACYQCGTVFVPKKVRKEEILGKKEQILKQAKEIKEAEEAEKLTPLTCPECGFVAKTEQGLKVHIKKHKKTASHQKAVNE